MRPVAARSSIWCARTEREGPAAERWEVRVLLSPAYRPSPPKLRLDPCSPVGRMERFLLGREQVEGDLAFPSCSSARMGGKTKKRGRVPVIDSAAKVAMLAALREGRRLDEVAAGYGVTLQAFYSARRRDPLFAAAWRDAHALSAEAERRRRHAEAQAQAEADAGDGTSIASNNRRLLQRRWLRHVRFDVERKGVFLACFAQSCDLAASAAAAGVCERTVHYHVRNDPAFADAFDLALREGYRRLEAESVRDRIMAQERIRAAMESAEAAGTPLPIAEDGAEFDRTMKLLARWERRDGQLGFRQVSLHRQRVWTFEEAIIDLDRKLDNLGVRLRARPPAGAG